MKEQNLCARIESMVQGEIDFGYITTLHISYALFSGRPLQIERL